MEQKTILKLKCKAMIIGYARVSTNDQNLDRQFDQLTKYGCERIFMEKVSGSKRERPELERMIDLDTTTPQGKLLFTIFAGISQFELMAIGTNIGLSKMADCTKGVGYHKLANISQWRLHDDAMKKAQTCLVNYQHRLSLPSYWGDGTTSSSDGMRVQVGVSSLISEHNPHYGSGKGSTIYRFVSDQYSTFYTKVINTNARDAVHVIDGLLDHETDLCINEHYTDTAGYTDQVFGLSHLLGFVFAPRIFGTFPTQNFACYREWYSKRI